VGRAFTAGVNNGRKMGTLITREAHTEKLIDEK